MKDKPIEKTVINEKNAAYPPNRGEVEALETHLTITEEQRQQLRAAIKIGVYQKLYQQNMLTGYRLDALTKKYR